MGKRSAGLLLHRRRESIEVLLVHPGGPYWARKDDGAWSIPKGEIAENEDPLETARRELSEETGLVVEGELIELEPVKQKGGKTVLAWMVESDCDPSEIRSNTFSIEWPPRSGRMQEFPEVDRAEWFPLAEAKRKILPSQLPLLEQLTGRIG